MPNIQLAASSALILAASVGGLTLATTRGLYANIYGYAVGPGGTPAGTRIQIVEVVSSTVIRCRVAPESTMPKTSSGSDLSAFGGGTIYFEAQTAEVPSLYLPLTSPAADFSQSQVDLLTLGTKAVVAAPVLAWASLANGQTFVTITPAGAANSRTINAALALSTDRPTFCAALAAELNTAGTTAYNWTVNASVPVDGLVGTAKSYGSAYNVAPTGTALVGRSGSITTIGRNDTSSGSGLELIESYFPVEDSTNKDFLINPAQWKTLVIVADEVGSTTAGTVSQLLPEGVTGGFIYGIDVRAGCSTLISATVNEHVILQQQSDSNSFERIELRKRLDGKWSYFGFCAGWSVSVTGATGRGAWVSIGVMNAFTTFVRATWGANGIKANRTAIQVFGEMA